jgi:DNA repair protein RecO (recombination protein O)
MQFLKDFGFVIKRTNIGEADKFLTIYTQNNGKVEVLAKGVRKIKSRRSGSIELLNLIKFQAVKTRKNFILTEVEVVNSFEEVKQDYSSVQLVFLVCELLNALCPVGEVNVQVFNLLKFTLDNID